MLQNLRTTDATHTRAFSRMQGILSTPLAPEPAIVRNPRPFSSQPRQVQENVLRCALRIFDLLHGVMPKAAVLISLTREYTGAELKLVDGNFHHLFLTPLHAALTQRFGPEKAALVHALFDDKTQSRRVESELRLLTHRRKGLRSLDDRLSALKLLYDEQRAMGVLSEFGSSFKQRLGRKHASAPLDEILAELIKEVACSRFLTRQAQRLDTMREILESRPEPPAFPAPLEGALALLYRRMKRSAPQLAPYLDAMMDMSMGRDLTTRASAVTQVAAQRLALILGRILSGNAAEAILAYRRRAGTEVASIKEDFRQRTGKSWEDLLKKSRKEVACCFDALLHYGTVSNIQLLDAAIRGPGSDQFVVRRVLENISPHRLDAEAGSQRAASALRLRLMAEASGDARRDLMQWRQRAGIEDPRRAKIETIRGELRDELHYPVATLCVVSRLLLSPLIWMADKAGARVPWFNHLRKSEALTSYYPVIKGLNERFQSMHPAIDDEELDCFLLTVRRVVDRYQMMKSTLINLVADTGSTMVGILATVGTAALVTPHTAAGLAATLGSGFIARVAAAPLLKFLFLRDAYSRRHFIDDFFKSAFKTVPSAARSGVMQQFVKFATPLGTKGVLGLLERLDKRKEVREVLGATRSQDS